MGYLIAAGIIVLVVGILLAFFKGFCEGTCKGLDRVILVLDDVLNPYRILVGLVIAAVGCWMLYLVAMVVPGYLWLHPIWVILILFGLIFIFSPHWLARISKIANKSIFSTEELVRRSGRIIGIIFILAGLYIFYTVYLMR